MTNEDYIKGMKKTEPNENFEDVQDRVSQFSTIRLLHHAIGISTEAGELLDALKKHIFYGKDLDRINLIEELGDLEWYIAGMIDALGTSFEEVQTKNIEKLKARYGEKFNENGALNRNLNVERKILEGKEGASK